MHSRGMKDLVHGVSQVIAYLSFDVTYYIEVKKFQGLQHHIEGGNTPLPKKINSRHSRLI